MEERGGVGERVGGCRRVWRSAEERGAFCMKAPGPSRRLCFYSLAAEIFEAGE